MSNLSLVNRYLTAFYAGSFEAAESCVADEFHFEGPFVETRGRSEFFSAAARLKAMVRGHVLQKQWEDQADICSIYDVALQTPIGTGNILMAEWNKVLNGKIMSGRLIFDSDAFRKIVPMAPAQSSQ